MAQRNVSNRTVLKNYDLIGKGEKSSIQEIIAKGNQWEKWKQPQVGNNSNRPALEAKVAERKLQQQNQATPNNSKSIQQDKNINHGKDI